MKNLKKHQVATAKFAVSTLLVTILSACNSGTVSPEYNQPKQAHSLKAKVEPTVQYKTLCFINETQSEQEFSVSSVGNDKSQDDDNFEGFEVVKGENVNGNALSGKTKCVSLAGVHGQAKLTMNGLQAIGKTGDFSTLLGKHQEQNIANGGDQYLLEDGKHDITLNISSQGDQVNVSILDSTVEQGMKNWMSYLKDDTPFKEITLPASHDAGMGKISSCSSGIVDSKNDWGLVNSNVAINQKYNVRGQLMAGARMFDIRMEKSALKPEELVTFHKTLGVGCQGEFILPILNSVTSFLDENSKEVAILRVTHTESEDMKKFLKTLTIAKYKEKLANVNKPLWANNNDDDDSLKLSEVAGKMIVIIDPKFQKLAEDAGLFDEKEKLIVLGRKLADNNGEEDHFNKDEDGQFGNTYGGFANSQNFDKVKNKIIKISNQIAKIRENNAGSHPFGGGRSSGFQASWTFTGGLNEFWEPQFNISSLAAQVNFYLPTEYAELSKKLKSKPNLVNLDYISPLLSAVIVKNNGVDFSQFENHRDHEVHKKAGHDMNDLAKSNYKAPPKPTTFSGGLKLISEEILNGEVHYFVTPINESAIEFTFEHKDGPSETITLSASNKKELILLTAMEELFPPVGEIDDGAPELQEVLKRRVALIIKAEKKGTPNLFNNKELAYIQLSEAEQQAKYLKALRNVYLPPVKYTGTTNDKSEALQQARITIAEMIATGYQQKDVFTYVDNKDNFSTIKEHTSYASYGNNTTSLTDLNKWLGRDWVSGWVGGGSWQDDNQGTWNNLVNLIQTTEGKKELPSFGSVAKLKFV